MTDGRLGKTLGNINGVAFAQLRSSKPLSRATCFCSDYPFAKAVLSNMSWHFALTDLRFCKLDPSGQSVAQPLQTPYKSVAFVREQNLRFCKASLTKPTVLFTELRSIIRTTFGEQTPCVEKLRFCKASPTRLLRLQIVDLQPTANKTGGFARP